MEKETVMIQRGTVQETLLIPLFARAEESLRIQNPILIDQKSMDVIRQINYDFTKISKDWITLISVIVRTRILDDLTREYIQNNPDALILNLGCGLCTRFFRMDNGRVNWIDLDMPDVITFKRKLIPESDRYHFIPKSLTDPSWVEDFKNFYHSPTLSNQKILIIAEGLLYYLESSLVQQIFDQIKASFPHAEMFIEVATKKMVADCYKYSALDQMGQKFVWGLDNIYELEKLNSNMKVKKQYLYYNRFRSRWKHYMLLHFVPSMRKSLTIVHLIPNKNQQN